MKKAPLAEKEDERIAALKSYDILDTLPEMDFDDFTKVASHICGTPIALISLVDESRQWFKSKFGLDAPETPRDIAFCSHAILQDKVFVVPDSFKDERFHDNPLATGAPDVRFYAGAPLNTPSGHKIGTLCVIDNQPRNIDKGQIEALEALARQVVNQLELRIAKKNTERVLETKSSFFANMSDEIRTPLNGVIGFTGLLLDEKLSKVASEHVQHIKECGESLMMVINDILDISKIEAGKLVIEKLPMNLEKTIETSMFVFSTVVSQKKISLDYSISESTPKFISGDSLRIRQVLLNLIGNAVKFTEKGAITIDVTSEGDVDGPEFNLLFKIKDTGVGIPQEAIHKLFKSFEQVDSSITRKYGGTGLGLSICAKLIPLMGGDIWVESEENKGSIFYFTLNSKKENTAKDAENYNIPRVKHTEGNQGDVIKILVAEDNKLNQTLVRKVLAKIGCNSVDIVENGREAIEATQNNDYDLLLMDVQMPEMGGYEATKIIKSNLKQKIKIVGLSANVFDEDKIKAKEAGMDDYLEKPINIRKISEVIESMMILKKII
jgi:signal transduction histidine kinase/ActR/RegA family two-component response regulator